MNWTGEIVLREIVSAVQGLDINNIPSNVTIPSNVLIVSIYFSTTASSLKYECYMFDSGDYLSLHDSDRDIRG